MRITRKTNIFVETVRKVVVQQPTVELFFCEQCTESMIPVQISADYFGFSSRIIYRLIEAEKIYFIETETNEIYVCPICVKQALKSIP